ncbi:hypothetical protein B0J14DRAFT_693859 [Halenospora varia]|nr:hypothetical protein B0J14DRAFT_693859 [Halenospora varia]
MKETTRTAPSTGIVYMRAILENHTLSTGLELKKGQYLCVSGASRVMDPTLFPNPEEYDFGFPRGSLPQTASLHEFNFMLPNTEFLNEDYGWALPEKAPVEQYHNGNFNSCPAALYKIADLSGAEFQELHRVADKGSMSEDNPLRAVYDYHLELGKQKVYHATLFIVAIDLDWKKNGVLIVTLDDDDLECNVDSFRIKAEESGLSYVNLKIGNSSWEEEKENYEIEPNGGDNGNDDDQGENNDPDNSPSRYDDPGIAESGPTPPSGPPAYGIYVGVYAKTGIDVDAVIQKLEVCPDKKQTEDFYCRLQAVIPGTSQDIVEAAYDLHASRCTRNQWLDKHFFFVMDTPDTSDNGVLLASVGSVIKVTRHPRGVQRIECSGRIVFQQIYCSLRDCDRDWIALDPSFGHFSYNGGGSSESMHLLDPNWGHHRGWGHIIDEPYRGWNVWSDRPPNSDKTSSLKEAVRKFPYFCYLERFRTKFSRTTFICEDSGDADSKGVLLVKVSWDGLAKGGVEVMASINLSDNVEVRRLPIRDAYDILQGVVEEKSNGEHQNQVV